MAISIVAKFLAPTNTRGTRINVTGFGRKTTYNWDYQLDTVPNFEAVFNLFVAELNLEAGTDYNILGIANLEGKEGTMVALVK